MQKPTKSLLEQFIEFFLILSAIWALCITWPLYQVLIYGATFFAAHNAGRIEISLLILVVSFAFPFIWALISTLAGLFGRLARNAVFATGVAVPLALFLAKAFIYKPWSWLPSWGLWILGVLLLGITIVITTLLIRLNLTSKESVAGLAVALLVVALFVFAPSMKNYFLPQSIQLSDKIKVNLINEKRPNIIVLVFDELSLMDMLDADGRINAKLFPNFAKLAEDSIWFPNAYAVTPQTHLNVPSIFTGMLPSKSNLPPTYQNHPLNITVLLPP